MVNPHLDAALDLASRGCKVFPIRAGLKKPAIEGWPDRATADPGTIRGWWRKWPDANVGIHTADLFVVDVDGPVGHALAQSLDLPPTLKLVSGHAEEDHHYQLIYRLPAGMGDHVLNKGLRFFKGYEKYTKIDIRSTRGQVVGPGSVHPTGGTYRRDGLPPGNVYADAAPEWALRMVAATPLRKKRPVLASGGTKGKKTARHSTRVARAPGTIWE